MDYSQLISTLGFPIVCCIALAIYISKITKTNREDIKELNEKREKDLKEIQDFKEEMKEALNNNTMAINKLCEKLSNSNERVSVKKR